MSANDFYQPIAEAVSNKKPFKAFNFYYRMLTDDKELKHYEPWIDYLLDKYLCYHSSGFNDFECQVNSLMDGLEGLLNE